MVQLRVRLKSSDIERGRFGEIGGRLGRKARPSRKAAQPCDNRRCRSSHGVFASFASKLDSVVRIFCAASTVVQPCFQEPAVHLIKIILRR
jgi:hypothetical protein